MALIYTHVAGGFVGGMYAMYATSNGKQTTNTATFNFFLKLLIMMTLQINFSVWEKYSYYYQYGLIIMYLWEQELFDVFLQIFFGLPAFKFINPNNLIDQKALTEMILWQNISFGSAFGRHSYTKNEN